METALPLVRRGVRMFDRAGGADRVAPVVPRVFTGGSDPWSACPVQPEQGIKEPAQLFVVLAGAKESDIQNLQTRPGRAAQLRREMAAALVVGLQSVCVLTVGFQVP
jgi:hypothetical protein